MNDPMIEFLQQLIRCQGFSSGEGEVVRLVAEEMRRLNFEEVSIDPMGNLLGRVGSGPASILFDSHADTVAVNDEGDWSFPPFGGEIRGGMICGRGAVDMKASIAASVYAAAMAADKGWLNGRTVYVSCTVNEEDCDGEGLKFLLENMEQRPGQVVICEPSGNRIALGHRGKAQVRIITHGKSAHGANPERGINAVYLMGPVIRRVEDLSKSFSNTREGKPTLVLSDIRSESASLNAVPSSCTVSLDRRLVPGESLEAVEREMDGLVAGLDAAWERGILETKSYTGYPIRYEPFHEPWMIGREEPLSEACARAWEKVFGAAPDFFEFWDFSTNAVAPVGMGIPTIGFGPGDSRMAHMPDEQNAVADIQRAKQFYAELMACFPG